jgi:dTDP-4-amino-4,6-dideoxygalactose transaminase
VLTNASYPLSPNAKATLQGPVVEEGAKVGGNSSLLPGVIIGKNSLVGAGSVVVKNIEKNKVVAGNPSLEVNNINKLSAYQSSENKRIPLTDLKAQYQEVSTELDAAVRRVLESGIYVSGAEISSFEKNFSTYIGTAYCKGVSSGTSALHLALEAAGIGVGHDVITSPFTFIATAEAIRHSGARTVFVDVNHQTLCLDQNKIEKAITRKTRAIVVVHIHGQPAAMDEILSIAKKHKLLVIEDAAQAHGARYKGRMIGSMGDAGCFSFFPAKNLGACGDAGAVVTNNPKIAERVSLLRDHGRKEKYLHESHGYNHRMDPLQAAILNVKLRYLDEWNQQRRAIADRYTSVLQKFFSNPNSRPIFNASLSSIHNPGSRER